MGIGKKKCLDCNKPYIFSKGLCQSCWKINYMKPIRKISFKQQVRNAEYKIVRDQFIKDNPICQANINNEHTKCTKEATDVHHQIGRIGERLTDVKNFIALCRNCHVFAENSPEEAKKIGLSNNRL